MIEHDDLQQVRDRAVSSIEPAEGPPVPDAVPVDCDLCPHGRRHCTACHDERDTQLARERWWSGEPGLLLPWYCRDHERVVSGLEPDGLWNGPTPCGATICGVPESDRAAMEARHRSDCVHGCGEVTTLKAVRAVLEVLRRDGIAPDKDGDYTLDHIAAKPERYRPEQVQARGRWRRRKQVLRRFAAELGWPECMEVAHDDQFVGAVLQAGLQLRDWRRFERSGRGRRKYERELRAAQKRRRKSLRQNFSSGDPPF